MIKLFRRMTQFQNSNLGGDFIPKTTPKVEVKLRSFQEDAEIFKEKFGKDYVSPFEKYDLHLPRSSILGGPDSMEERLHKKKRLQINEKPNQNIPSPLRSLRHLLPKCIKKKC